MDTSSHSDPGIPSILPDQLPQHGPPVTSEIHTLGIDTAEIRNHSSVNLTSLQLQGCETSTLAQLTLRYNFSPNLAEMRLPELLQQKGSTLLVLNANGVIYDRFPPQGFEQHSSMSWIYMPLILQAANGEFQLSTCFCLHMSTQISKI